MIVLLEKQNSFHPIIQYCTGILLCGRPDKYAAMSVDARQELDLKIGVAFSRLMTKAYLDMAKEKFRSEWTRGLSYFCFFSVWL